MVVCAVLEMALQMQTGSAGYFALLPHGGLIVFNFA
jgi:hypothetical protein